MQEITRTTTDADRGTLSSPVFSVRDQFLEDGVVVGSKNERLETLFAANPHYLNRELLYPCVLDDTPVYESRAFTEWSERDRILSRTGTIITPRSAAKLSPAKAEKLELLASPFECGRVLEFDEKIEFQGRPRVITVKGIGCTEFARTTGGENRWMLPMHRDFTPEQARKLARFPFLSADRSEYGVLHRPFAVEELEGVRDLQSRGADTEQILGIYSLQEVADERGVLRPISWYQERGVIHEKAEPVVMYRALKSNFRLLDFVMLDETKCGESVEALLEHAKREYALEAGVRNPDANSYLSWIVRKVYRQELPLILDGYEMSSGRWQDLGRNISLLGEELDLEDVGRKEYGRQLYPHELADRVKRHVGALEGAFRSFAGVISYYSAEQIDAEAFADAILDEIRDALTGYDFQQRFEQFEETGRYDLREFRRLMVGATVEQYLHYYLFARDDEFCKAYQAHAKKRLGRNETEPSSRPRR